MKPTQADIDWCLANRELVNRWLGRRGGWQEGDWYTTKGYPASDEQFVGLIHNANWRAYPDALWLPTEGDVLQMLEVEGVSPELLSLRLESVGGCFTIWLATDGVVMVPDVRKCHKTPLIALMELLKCAPNA